MRRSLPLLAILRLGARQENFQPPDGGFLLFIQRLAGGQPTDAGFQVNENVSVKTVVIDNQVTLRFTGNLISINATGHHNILLTSSDATQTATPSGDPSSACRAISGFSGARSASAGSSFPDVPFPPASLGYQISTTYYGSYLSRRIEICGPALSADGARAFMLANMPADGWTQSSTFPYEGNPSRACGDPYCWTQDSSPAYYVSLEQVSQRGSRHALYAPLGDAALTSGSIAGLLAGLTASLLIVDAQPQHAIERCDGDNLRWGAHGRSAAGRWRTIPVVAPSVSERLPPRCSA